MLTRPNVLLENAEITFLCTLSSRVEEEEGAKSFPGDNAGESRAHIVGKCELHREERNVFDRWRRKRDGCDMKKFGTLRKRSLSQQIDGQRGRRNDEKNHFM